MKERQLKILTYIPESKGLAFIGLDSEGNETEDERKIVEYMVGDNRNFSEETLIIPKTYNNKPVTRIKIYAFKDNKLIKKAIIPDTINMAKSGQYIFNNCSNLEHLIVNAESFGEYSPVFSGCAIKKLEISKSVKSIGMQTFKNCTNLTDVTIYSENIERLGAMTFAGCTSLEKIKVNSDNNGYKEVEGVIYSKDGKKLILYPPGKTNENFAIISTVEEIGARACSNNNFLKNVNIPNTIKKVEEKAFNNCNSMEYLHLDAEIVEGEYTFQSSSLAKVDIGENVSLMKKDTVAFGNCSNLTELTIYSEEIEISAYQFWGCTSLEQFKLKENHAKYTAIDGVLYSKDGKTLYACPSGKKGEFIIPDEVEIIEKAALQSSYPNMTKLEIPNTVKTAYFGYFKPLANIDYKGTMEEWSAVTITSKAGTTVKTVTCTDGTVNL